MIFGGNAHRLTLLSGLTVAAILIVPAAAWGDGKKAAPPAPKKGAAATVSAFTEAQALRQAYLMLAGANHDYDGHRAKAMHAVKAAVAILDGHVMAHGSKAQKQATKQENAAIVDAEKAANAAPVVGQPQPLSDRRLAQAGEQLAEVRAILAKQKQKRVLGHVDAAIKETGIALKVR